MVNKFINISWRSINDVASEYGESRLYASSESSVKYIMFTGMIISLSYKVQCNEFKAQCLK